MARAVSFRTIALGAPLEFGNHRKGFKLFERWVQDLIQTCKKKAAGRQLMLRLQRLYALPYFSARPLAI
ncbi:hypothetical protein GCM10010917_23920 [Paenibacillus physcomitrellae]|uniref:Transposase n=1 Tax=Paenibacillus physcomitrellae TaxID=1619311 RepID=A0ABQ1G6W9_9BACL|nr:hypothetical protein GCM10010917_23920 [Paenibacillus physcomitrellae]